MEQIKHILMELQNGHSLDNPYSTIRNIIKSDLMHVATTPTHVVTYGERGHKYMYTIRLYGKQEPMKITDNGGELIVSFYNEDWTTNLGMSGWDGTPGTWYCPQIKHLDNLINTSVSGGFIDLIDK